MISSPLVPWYCLCLFFFFQAEDGIRDDLVTGVQTCALPIYIRARLHGTSYRIHSNRLCREKRHAWSEREQRARCLSLISQTEKKSALTFPTARKICTRKRAAYSSAIMMTTRAVLNAQDISQPERTACLQRFFCRRLMFQAACTAHHLQTMKSYTARIRRACTRYAK